MVVGLPPSQSSDQVGEHSAIPIASCSTSQLGAVSSNEPALRFTPRKPGPLRLQLAWQGPARPVPARRAAAAGGRRIQ